jgi:hypothetical protein
VIRNGNGENFLDLEGNTAMDLSCTWTGNDPKSTDLARPLLDLKREEEQGTTESVGTTECIQTLR